MGYNVATTSNGYDAINLVRKSRENNSLYKAIIMDLTVPGGMGGKEAIGRIKELSPDSAVIASSGYSDDPVISNPEVFGFSASITKPYNKKQLINLMNQVFH